MKEEQKLQEVTIEQVCEHFNKTPEQLSHMLIKAGLVNNNQYRQLIKQFELEQEAMTKSIKRNRTYVDYVLTNIEVETINRPGFPNTVRDIENLQGKIVDINNDWAQRMQKEKELWEQKNNDLSHDLDKTFKEVERLKRIELNAETMSKMLSRLSKNIITRWFVKI